MLPTVTYPRRNYNNCLFAGAKNITQENIFLNFILALVRVKTFLEGYFVLLVSGNTSNSDKQAHLNNLYCINSEYYWHINGVNISVNYTAGLQYIKTM